MRLLVVGANGLLGSNVVRTGQQFGWDVSGTYHSTKPAFDIPLTQFDLQDYQSFGAIIDAYDPDVVVNCAAMTDVDACETNADKAHRLNGEAPGELAAVCEANEIDFIHISTDYVFDGTARTPYRESATPNPVQVYGKSKRAGERAVQENTEACLIARLSFVWGIHRSTEELTGFPAWVLSRLQSNDTVPVFTDQWVTPTRAGQAAETVLELLEQDATGLYHIACSSCVTPYEFGDVLAEYHGAGPHLLKEGSMDDVERKARRPTYSCLDVEHVEESLGRPQPTLREAVAAVEDAVR